MNFLKNYLTGIRYHFTIYLLFVYSLLSATDIAVGDLAITSLNTDDLDEFSFILLADISGTTTVYFTENGWNSNTNNWAATSEGTLIWTFTGNLSAGTEIQVNTPRATVSVSHGSITRPGSFSLSSSGDGLIAYTGTGIPNNGTEVTNFIWMFNTGTTGFVASPASTTQSAVPSGLTDGMNALDFAGNTDDNFVFECSKANINTVADLRAALADAGNFSTTQDSENFVAPGCTYLDQGDFTEQVFWLGATDDVLVRGNVVASTGALVNVFTIVDLSTLPGITLASPNGLSIDETNSKIYWTDRGDVDGIYRADLDGENAELYSTANSPRSIYVDDPNGYIYYTDDGNNELRRLDIVASAADAKNEVSITGLSNLNFIRGIVYDATSGRIFWTDNGGDGGANETFHSANLTSGSTAATGQTTIMDFGSGATHADIYFDEVNRRIFLSLSNVTRYYEIDTDQVVNITAPTTGTNRGGITVDAANGHLYLGETNLDIITRGDYPAGGNPGTVINSGPGSTFPFILTTYTGPVVAPPTPTMATVATTVLLEGAYNGTNLNTALNSNIPTTQPYSINGHAGGEIAGSIPAGAVDWVLVELREAGSAAVALSSTRVGSAAGFLMNDGSIKAIDGTSDLSIALSGNTGSDFFVVIYHRNHLPIMSATAQSATSTISVDFTSASATAFNGATGLATLSGGKFGMLAGDADGDGDIDATDLATWKTQNLRNI